MYCDVRKSSGSNFSVTDIKKLTWFSKTWFVNISCVNFRRLK